MTRQRRSAVRLEVASLVSGIPSCWRGRRIFVVLQTFADESFGKKYTVIAGYISREEKWEQFSDAWQDALELKPKIKYLKFKEANSLSGQFGRFSERKRDERLAVFIDVIKQFVLSAIVTAVSEKDYKDVLQGKFLITQRSKRLDNPYCQAFFNFMLDAISLVARDGIREKTDFIFDQQEVFKNRVMGVYDHFLASATDRELEYLGSPPIFRDDRCFLPLQASDVLSGYVNRRSRALPYAAVFDELKKVPVVLDVWKRQRMQSQLEISNAILSKIQDSEGRGRQKYMAIRGRIPTEYKERLRVGLSYPEIGQLKE